MKAPPSNPGLALKSYLGATSARGNAIDIEVKRLANTLAGGLAAIDLRKLL